MIADLVARRNAVLTQQVELTQKVVENRQLKNDYEAKLEAIDKQRPKQ